MRILAVMTAVAIGGGVMCLADDPPAPRQAEKTKEKAQGFGQPGTATTWSTVLPTTIARYEEEAETTEAQLNTKKAHVRAAEVNVQAAKIKTKNADRLFENKVISIDERDLSKLEVEAAIAQLEIRMAEMKEVEVRLKHTKKRLEDAKAAPPRPVPGFRNKGVDPKPIDPQQN